MGEWWSVQSVHASASVGYKPRLIAGFWASFLIVVALLVGFATQAHADQLLAPNDQVKVTVFGEQELSGEFAVDAAGFISLPLIGKVIAGNGTVEQLESAIVEKLLDGYLKDPRVGVEVLSLRSIYVLGEVDKPGSYPYSVGLTALRAVALAGGFTYRARKNGIRITRASEKAEQKVAGDEAVFPGDMVRVPERFF